LLRGVLMLVLGSLALAVGQSALLLLIAVGLGQALAAMPDTRQSVLTGNITRVVENLCHEELQVLNRGIGHLLGQQELETAKNPFAPGAIVEAFAESLHTLKADPGVKHTILKELNRASLTEINSIYADLNKHLQNLHVIPALSSRPAHGRRSAARRAKDHPEGPPADAAHELPRPPGRPPGGPNP